MVRCLALVAALALAWPATAHDWYEALSNALGQDCCGKTECHPTSMCRLRTGREGILAESYGCVPIPRDVVLKLAGPDGRPHICIWGFFIRCVILPGGG